MGGRWEGAFTKSTTHLIADLTAPEVLISPKYIKAVELRIPIVSTDWLFQCFIHGRRIPLPVLKSLTICITGFDDAMERESLRTSITSLGATYTSDLSQSCTHLIAACAGSQKYVYAKEWGLYIVNKKWLEACEKEEKRVKEAEYAVSEINITPSIEVDGMEETEPLEHGITELNPSNTATSIPPHHESNALPHCNDGKKKHGDASNRIASKPDVLQPPSVPLQSDSKGEDKENQYRMEYESTLPALPFLPPSDDIVYDAFHDSYLDGVQVCLIGLEGEELWRCIKIIRGSGGTRYNEVRTTATHIVSTSRTAIIEIIKETTRLYGIPSYSYNSIPMVSTAWLKECYAAKERVDETRVTTTYSTIHGLRCMCFGLMDFPMCFLCMFEHSFSSPLYRRTYPRTTRFPQPLSLSLLSHVLNPFSFLRHATSIPSNHLRPWYVEPP